MTDQSLFNNTSALVFLGGVLIGAAAVTLLGNMKKSGQIPFAAAPQAAAAVSAPEAEEIIITDADDIVADAEAVITDAEGAEKND